MALIPSLYNAHVMHKRLFPRENTFNYSVYYTALPLSCLPIMTMGRLFTFNRWGLLSFYTKDYGDRSGRNPMLWARAILDKHNIQDIDDVLLIAMPRVLGYVFNPVSFWLCISNDKRLRAVIAEVNNTFGESHAYLCAKPDGLDITSRDWLNTAKLFHVSPFLEREGNYRFRFDWHDNNFSVWIDFYDGAGAKQLITSLVGTLRPMTRAALLKAFFSIPLVTLKTIILIHWQALRLMGKKIRYIVKPKQLKVRVSTTMNKMS